MSKHIAVGDKVKVTKCTMGADYKYYKKGAIGKVVDLDKGCAQPYGVKFTEGDFHVFDDGISETTWGWKGDIKVIERATT